MKTKIKIITVFLMCFCFIFCSCNKRKSVLIEKNSDRFDKISSTYCTDSLSYFIKDAVRKYESGNIKEIIDPNINKILIYKKMKKIISPERIENITLNRSSGTISFKVVLSVEGEIKGLQTRVLKNTIFTEEELHKISNIVANQKFENPNPFPYILIFRIYARDIYNE